MRVLLLLALCLLTTLWLATRERAAPVASAPARAPGPPARGGPLELEGPPTPEDAFTPAAPAGTPESPRDSARREPPQRSSAYGPPHWPVLSGEVVVLDHRGAAQRGLTGGARLSVWREGGKGRRGLMVEDGRFAVKLPVGSEVEFGVFEMGGRIARLEPSQDLRHALGGGLELELRVRWRDPIVIDVVAADGETPLPRAAILPTDEVEGDLPLAEGAEVEAPVEISCEEAPVPAYWVRAPGHAWRRIEVDPWRGGRHEARLEPGGDVRLTVVGAPAGDWVLGVLSEERWLEAERSIRGGESVPSRLCSLPVGPCTLHGALRRGEYHASLGETRIEVRPGVASVAVLRLEAPPVAGELAGELLVPPAWGGGRPRLELEPRKGRRSSRYGIVVEPVDPTAGRWRWSAGEAPAGVYEASVRGVPVELQVEFDGWNPPPLHFPPPTELLVRVLDGRTDEPLGPEDAGVSWTLARQPRLHRRLDWDPARGGFTGTVPDVMLLVEASGPRHAPVERRVDPALAGGRVSVTLEAGVLVDFHATLDGAPVDSMVDLGIGVYTSTGEGEWWAGGIAPEPGDYLLLPEPGDYRLLVEVPEEIEPVEPFDLAVGEDGGEHLLELRSRR